MLQRLASLVGAVALLLSAAQPARAQHRIYVRTYPGYGYGGFYPYYGYDGFYSNGFSMYGPPVPTYGPVPGYFGGGDQRLNNYYYPEPVRPSRHHQRVIVVLPAEVDRQAVDLPTE